MKDIITKIITNVLTALYEPLGFAILASVLFMFLYLFAKEHGIKEAFKIWVGNFKKSKKFRGIFLLAFVVIMILFRTLLNRNMWLNPLSDVMGGWGIHSINTTTGRQEITTEGIENVILFIPFLLLLLLNFHNNIIKGDISLGKVLWKSLYISFLCSLGIELTQLTFRLGTFQISDLTYNTLGGIIGGLIFYGVYKVKLRD